MIKIFRIALSIIFVSVFGWFLIYTLTEASSDDNISGYAWSENIGWISFNNTTGGGSDYGVQIDPSTGDLSGYAWSENIGWISFNRSDAGDPPSNPFKNGIPIANYDENTGQITGWMRVLAYSGGWDGWIRFCEVSICSGNTATIDSNKDWHGWAWSDMVVGWISFNSVEGGSGDYKVELDATNEGTNIKVTTNTVSQPACYFGAPTPTVNWTIGSEAVPPAIWPASDQASYQVQIDQNQNFNNPEIDTSEVTSVKNNPSSDSYTVDTSGLSFDQTYYWRVKIKDSFDSWTDWVVGDSTFTTVGSCNNPPTATGLDRVAGDYCTTPAYYFSWTYTDADSDTQSRYQFQVDNNSGFSSPEVDRDYPGLSNPSPTVNNQTVVIAVSPSPDQIGYNDTYYWRVKVYDSEGDDSGWIEGSNFTTAEHQYPTVDFSWSPISPSVDEDTLFSDLSTAFGVATISSWSWTFADGNPVSSSQQDPIVQFTLSGGKLITLQVTDSDTYSCTDFKTVTIQEPLPGWREN